MKASYILEGEEGMGTSQSDVVLALFDFPYICSARLSLPTEEEPSSRAGPGLMGLVEVSETGPNSVFGSRSFGLVVTSLLRKTAKLSRKGKSLPLKKVYHFFLWKRAYL